MTARSSPSGRILDADLPGLAVGVVAMRDEVSARFDQEITRSSSLQPSGRPAERQPLADPSQIDRTGDGDAASPDPLYHAVAPGDGWGLGTRFVEGRPAIAKSIEIAEDARVEPAAGDAPGTIRRNEGPTQA